MSREMGNQHERLTHAFGDDPAQRAAGSRWVRATTFQETSPTEWRLAN